MPSHRLPAYLALAFGLCVGSAAAQERPASQSLRPTLRITLLTPEEEAELKQTQAAELAPPREVPPADPVRRTVMLAELAAQSGQDMQGGTRAWVMNWGGDCVTSCGHLSHQARWMECRDTMAEQADRVCADFRNMYGTCEGLAGLGLALGVAAPLANTQADQEFRDWYQRRARSRTADRAAEIGNHFGAHWYTVPVYVTAVAGAYAFPDNAGCTTVGEWGHRSIRALVVGAPAVGVLQIGLGASRPEEGQPRWRPLNDNNGVSGHAFVGAVPFLAAASMTENRPLKGLFVAGSLLTTWARVHDDSHYLSHAVLGWSIAFLATHAVNQTEAEYRPVSLAPVELPDTVGVGVTFRY